MDCKRAVTALVVVTAVTIVSMGPVLAATADRTVAKEGTGLLDLPYDDLLVAWLIAAAIGAVGGVVYFGIVGPPRRGDRDRGGD